MPRQLLTHSIVHWDEGQTPSSTHFDDIYYSPDDAVAEVNHVFLDGTEARETWQSAPLFTIGETGFGTGLNFLVTWQAWQKSSPQNARLHYFSVEAFPLQKEDLEKALSAFPELGDHAAALTRQWPALEPGFHNLDFDNGRVRLTLMLGEAGDMFKRADFSADAWYLDGFAPAKNPEMWRDEVLAEIARLSHGGTKLATFSSAGFVKRGLEAVGFETQKTEGFGRKRERIIAEFEGGNARLPVRPARVAIIGGGIAGCHLAHELKKCGATPIIFEAGDTLGSEASGNPAALIDLRTTLGNDPACRFYNLAFWDAVRLYDELDHTHGGLWLAPRGVCNIPTTQEGAERLKKLASHYALDDEDMHLDSDNLVLPKAGCLRPKRLLELLTHGVDVRLNSALSPTDIAALYDDVDHVVFASGIKSYDLAKTPSPTVLVRGQISLIKDLGEASQTLSFGNYLSPAIDGQQVLGATYQREAFDDESWRNLRADDHDQCVTKLKAIKLNTDIKVIGGRANLRVSTPDRMPLAGQLSDQKWIMTGFGSRGFQTASFVAKIMSAQITGASYGR